MKTKTLYLFLCLSVSLNAFSNPPAEEGRMIFSSRCAGCHNVNKILTGPALAGVDKRRDINWIINFVRSSQSVIKGGDKVAMELFNKFNNIPMPDHKDLSEADIKNVVAFINSETKTGTDAAPFSRPGKLRPSYTPISITNYGFFITYIAAVLLLVGGLIALVTVKELQRNKAA